ncbi:hypothetical protein B0T20DRAFT_423688 [Sordaria brevicollis]|uniref:Uncharacterized protein n=1 Tax=Sordaria brevicollis TaxID=83679 RepID=A0AAE0P0Z8_SORBR|nr:hypothetical protein B0T20DRAFT_423688 [Sordaria brevicollis]
MHWMGILNRAEVIVERPLPAFQTRGWGRISARLPPCLDPVGSAVHESYPETQLVHQTKQILGEDGFDVSGPMNTNSQQQPSVIWTLNCISSSPFASRSCSIQPFAKSTIVAGRHFTIFQTLHLILSLNHSLFLALPFSTSATSLLIIIMKLITSVVLALVSVAFAYPTPGINNAQVVRRQDLQHDIDPSVPAMSDANGNVVPFSTDSVFQAAAANGQ